MSEVTPLTPAEVAHVAALARLTLTDDEIERFTGQLASVLAHANDVASLDLSGLEPTAHPLELRNVLRADVVTPSLDRDEVLSQAPEVIDQRFGVPKIVGDAP